MAEHVTKIGNIRRRGGVYPVRIAQSARGVSVVDHAAPVAQIKRGHRSCFNTSRVNACGTLPAA